MVAIIYYHTILILIPILFLAHYFLSLIMNRLLMDANYSIYTGGSRLFYILLGPGIVIHETSHALMCKILRVKIYEFKPLAIKRQGNIVQYGWVKREATDNPIKEALISTAPITIGLLILFLTVTILFWQSLGKAIWTDFNQLISMNQETPIYEPLIVLQNALIIVPSIWIQRRVLDIMFWLIPYFALTISLSAVPSEGDLQKALQGIKYVIVGYLGFIAIVAIFPIVRFGFYGVFEVIFIFLAISLSLILMSLPLLLALFLTFKINRPWVIFPYLLLFFMDYILYPKVGPLLNIFNLAIFYIILIAMYMGIRSSYY